MVGNAVAADIESGLRECSRIEDSVKRLACFDALAKEHEPQPVFDSVADETGETASDDEAVRRWNVEVEVSKIDDSTNVFMHQDSLEPVAGRYGGAARLSFWIACRENTTSLWIYFAGYFMSDLGAAGDVTYRIDKQPARVKSFTESSDHEALGLWHGGSAIPFIRSLFGAQRLLVRAMPYSESEITGEFDISGLEGASKRLREACHW